MNELEIIGINGTDIYNIALALINKSDLAMQCPHLINCQKGRGGYFCRGLIQSETSLNDQDKSTAMRSAKFYEKICSKGGFANIDGAVKECEIKMKSEGRLDETVH